MIVQPVVQPMEQYTAVLSTHLALVPPPLPPVPAELVPARPLAVAVPAATGVGSPPVPPLVSPLLPPPPPPALSPVTVAVTAPVASPTPAPGPRPPRASHPLNRRSHWISSFVLFVAVVFRDRCF